MNNSETMAAAISVPQGGGALHGLGEKFVPDPFTGAGTFTVPIQLPEGRRGLHPSLTLAYSPGTPNGPFGFGWSLNVPTIARLTSRGMPKYLDNASLADRDTFVLSGSEDLVELPPAANTTPGSRRYRPRTEGLFARIERQIAPNLDWWRVATKDGQVSTFGSIDPSVVSALADPDASQRIFAWRLTETRDPFGNRIVYTYRRDRTIQPNRSWNQLYLDRISYVDLDDPAGAPFLITVQFLYDDDAPPAGVIPDVPVKTRPDPFSDYRAGFEIRTARRCKWIVVSTHPSQTVTVPMRAIELVYLDESETDPTALPLNAVSLLARIAVVGFDDAGAAHRELPPLELSYSRFTPEQRSLTTLAGDELPASSLADPDLELVDLFGSGLIDVLELGQTARYWRNIGDGRFDRPCPLAAPAGVRLSNAGVQLLDADGNGRADLLVTENGIAGYFPLDFRTAWNSRSFRRYDEAPSFNLEDAEVRLLDLTGDGVADAVRSGARFECYFNDASHGWLPDRIARIPRKSLDLFPDVSFSDPRVKLADMTGDGLQDIVLIHASRLDYWPNLGYGRWGARLTLSIPGRLPFDFDPARALLADVDGDGAADLVYVSDRMVTLWINQSGNALSEPNVFAGTPATTNNDTVRVSDLFGSGVSGLLWSRAADGSGHPQHFFLDFTAGTKPYLLSRMDNHLGAVTDVDYTPSTTFYVRDQPRAATRWRTTLPFPVQVVRRVVVRDALSGGTITTEYRYHHGYWDGVEREFRGFGMVERIDTETFDAYAGRDVPTDATPLQRALTQETFAPPVLTRTWFHQGPVEQDSGGNWVELDWTSEHWPGDANVLGHVAAVQTFLDGLPPSARRPALRVLRGSVLRTETYALDGSPIQDRPYTVTERALGLREEEPPAPGDDRQRIFFPMATAERTTQWERGDDPLTQLAYTGAYDEVGQPAAHLSVACPRGWRQPADRPATPYLALFTYAEFAAVAVVGPYIRDRVARTRSFEVTGTDGKTIAELAAIDQTSASLQLNGESRNFYDATADASTEYGAFAGRPVGELGGFGALVRTETLALTDAIVADAYGAAPPYLVPDGAFTANADYPQGFVTALPPDAGYVYRAADATTSGGYYAVAESLRYDFHSQSQTGRGLALGRRDRLGHLSTVEYDPYDLLPARLRSPVGLETRAEYNPRVLQPSRITDANGNVTEVAYSPLGFVTDTWARGKPAASAADRLNAGDRTAPSAHVEYDFLAFRRGQSTAPPTVQPIFTHAVRRVCHDSDPDDTGAVVEAREFSDGFGRVLQTRTIGEAIRFGDEHFGGGDTLLPLASPVPLTIAGMPGSSSTPNVVVTGSQRYDNKGRVIEKFEPFWSAGWDYAPPEAWQLGASWRTFYDPRGQVVRTIGPDRSEQRVFYGVPLDLADPPWTAADAAKMRPTAWEVYTYDQNDNAGRTHAGDPAVGAYRHHWNTPASVEVDALGRTIRAVQRNRDAPASSGDPLPPLDASETRSRYDIRGSLLEITDALGRLAFGYIYDLSQRALVTSNVDSGVRSAVYDAAGNAIEARDSRGALALHVYDDANRPLRFWARDAGGEPVTLREQVLYGDDPLAPGTVSDRQQINVFGRPLQNFDEAGSLTFGAYDFKGNITAKSRWVLSDDFLLADVRAQAGASWTLTAPRVNWEAAPPPALDARSYDTRITHDALNRVKTIELPTCANGDRYRIEPTFNAAGALHRVVMVGPLDAADQGPATTFVERIAYNAKGQRLLATFGNGLITRYAYDPHTFRLARLRTESITSAGAAAYTASGQPVQDMAYVFDLAGNILRIDENVQGCGIRNSTDGADALTRSFDYDALYRLLSATGRECSALRNQRPWDDYEPCAYNSWSDGVPNLLNAPDMTSAYRETYECDPAGNLLSIRHSAAGGGVWVRYFGVGGFTPAQWIQALADWKAGVVVDWGTQGNRMTNAATGDVNAAASHAFDASGNLVRENIERHFEWDCGNRLKAFRNQVDDSQPTIYALYLYDASGARIKKLVWTGADYRTVTYVDGTFEHHTRVGAAATVENSMLHVLDGQRRIAIVRVGTAFADDGAADQPVQYHHGDHLGSATLVVGGSGVRMSREEFYPYGESSFGGFGRKRFRFTGAERDEETGLSYHGARFLSHASARWISCDRAGGVDGTNLYAYGRGNPIRFIDTRGLAVRDPSTIRGQTPPGEAEASEFESLPNHENVGSNVEAGTRSEVAAAEESVAEESLAGGAEATEAGLATAETGAQAGTATQAAGVGTAGAGLAVFTALFAGMYALISNSLTQQRGYGERARRNVFGTALYQAGLINNQQLQQYIQTNQLPYRQTNVAGMQRWFEIGRNFERFVLNNGRGPTGEYLRDLLSQGKLDVQFVIRGTSDPETDRIPDFFAWAKGLPDWVGDAKLGSISLEQGMAFVDAAATTQRKLLVYFVPDETVQVPQDLLDYARSHRNAKGQFDPVTIRRIVVHGFDDWIPRAGWRR
jgi:RHS repeat-associated protein